jgi:hypothetical protein
MHMPRFTPAPRDQAPAPSVTEGMVAHDYSPAPQARRRLQALTLTVLGCTLLASAALQVAHDPRPMDQQLAGTLRQAGDTLAQWQAHVARGLQVSLRAVADGRDTPDKPAEGDDSRAVSAQAPLPQRR